MTRMRKELQALQIKAGDDLATEDLSVLKYRLEKYTTQFCNLGINFRNDINHLEDTIALELDEISDKIILSYKSKIALQELPIVRALLENERMETSHWKEVAANAVKELTLLKQMYVPKAG